MPRRKEADKKQYYVTETLKVGTFVWAFSEEEAMEIVSTYPADGFDVLDDHHIDSAKLADELFPENKDD